MAGVEVPSVRIYFGLGYGSGQYLTIGDPVKGIIDGATYLIADAAGDGVEVGGDSVSFSIQRGRSRELDEIDTGTATVVVENFGRVYDALNTGIDGYGVFAAVAGNNVSTPDAAALDIVGDICVVVDVALDDWTPALLQTLVAKFAVGSRSFYFGVLPGGTLYFGWTVDGATVLNFTSTVLAPFVDGQRGVIAATFDVDNGAGGRSGRFWTSTDNGGTWTQLGATVTTAGVTSIYSGTSPVEVGAYNSASTAPTSGTIYAVSVRNGIGAAGVVGGTEVFGIRPADWPANTASTFTAVTGQTVTVNRSGGSPTVTAPGAAASPYLDDLSPGKRITIGLHGQTLFDGSIEDIEIDWPVDSPPTAMFTAEDALGSLARKEFNAWTAAAGQTAGPRLASILDRSEVSFGPMRDLNTGYSSLQGDSITWGSNVLAYAQLVARSDLGRLFASRDGQLVFRDRLSLIGPAVEVTFRDDNTEVEFLAILTQTGSRFLVNRVGVDREGGTLQTAEGDTSLGVRALNITGLLMDSDGQSRDMAEYLLGIYGTPTTRIAKLTIDVTGLADMYKARVAALDIGSKVRVVWTPLAVGSTVDQTLAVEGVEHSWTAYGHHIMNIELSPAFQQAAFIIDDPVSGVIGNDYVLAF